MEPREMEILPTQMSPNSQPVMVNSSPKFKKYGCHGWCPRHPSTHICALSNHYCLRVYWSLLGFPELQPLLASHSPFVGGWWPHKWEDSALFPQALLCNELKYGMKLIWLRLYFPSQSNYKIWSPTGSAAFRASLSTARGIAEQVRWFIIPNIT